MKRAYTRPSLEVVSFELNESVASGCGLSINHAVNDCTDTDEWKDLEELTGANLTEDTSCEIPLDAYCYFTSNGTESFVFTS